MTLRDKMLAVIADTNDSVAEREELVEMIAISLLTRKNLFVLGEPGQAKSYAINLFRRHITGARQFERLLSKQSDEEQLFGRVDLASLLPGSVPQTVLEQDATYQNQRFNLRVLVEGIGSMKDEPATWEKLKSGTEKLELYRAALSALHKSEPTVQTAGKIPEADNVERPKSQRYVGAFYSVSELETLFQAVKGDPCEFPVLMAAFYGLRRSEIMGLRWRAIDFESNLITIDHTVVQCMCDGTTITVEKDRTKNQSSCRSMPLVPQYRDLLLRMKVRQECCRKLCGNCYTESEYIFVNDMGEPYQPNYVTQHFKLVLRKNHLRSIRFHDLRHTCASLLLKNGVPMKDIQEWLGHSSYNTTANIYAHLDTSSKNTSASKMSNVVIIEPGISTSV